MVNKVVGTVKRKTWLGLLAVASPALVPLVLWCWFLTVAPHCQGGTAVGVGELVIVAGAAAVSGWA
jgi:hypothetical protein